MDTASQQLLRVAQGVLEQLDVDAVLHRVLEAARELTGARYAALGVLDRSRGELSRFLTSGIDDATRRVIGPLPTGRGVLGELIRHPAPLRIDDVGRHPYSYGFPVGHPPMRTFLGVPVLVDGRPYGNLYLTEKQGGRPFTEDDEQAAIMLAGFAGLAVDHAERFASVEAERNRLQGTVDALDAMIQIARALGGETDLAVILELVAKRGRALVGARALIIELVEGDELVLAAGAGDLPPKLLGTRVPLADTVASAALRAGQVQRLADELNRVRFQQHGVGRFGLQATDGIVVPLVFRNERYGVLVALDRIGSGAFTAEDETLLSSFAASAATAVATAQSAADERARQRIAAAEGERARWARELHDETLQALAGLRLMLSSARRSADPERLEAAVVGAVEQLEREIASLRELITQLRPAALDQLGLEPAVLGLVDRARAGGLEVDAHVDLAWEQGRLPTRLAPELETGIYRIVQEALTNATKHGRAGRASVEVIETDELVTVQIRDDGSGFDPEARTDGFGLLGMHERVTLLAGRIDISSTPGQGTTIEVIVPARHSSEPSRPTGAHLTQAGA